MWQCENDFSDFSMQKKVDLQEKDVYKKLSAR